MNLSEREKERAIFFQLSLLLPLPLWDGMGAMKAVMMVVLVVKGKKVSCVVPFFLFFLPFIADSAARSCNVTPACVRANIYGALGAQPISVTYKCQNYRYQPSSSPCTYLYGAGSFPCLCRADSSIS